MSQQELDSNDIFLVRHVLTNKHEYYLSLLTELGGNESNTETHNEIRRLLFDKVDQIGKLLVKLQDQEDENE